MKYTLRNSKITETNTISKLKKAISFKEYSKTDEYDINIDYYNDDLDTEKLNVDVAYEIKKKHLQFVKNVRQIFADKSIKINEVSLIGEVNDLLKGDINVTVNKSKYQDFVKNRIIPCKEIFMYEDSKKDLDFLLKTNQISEDEYETNIDILQDEYNITEIEEESEYIN